MVRDARVKFSRESVNSLVIQSVAATAIRVSGETYAHAIALTPEQLISDWQPKAIEDLSIDDFEVYENGKLQRLEAVYLVKKQDIERKD